MLHYDYCIELEQYLCSLFKLYTPCFYNDVHFDEALVCLRKKII